MTLRIAAYCDNERSDGNPCGFLRSQRLSFGGFCCS